MTLTRTYYCSSSFDRYTNVLDSIKAIRKEKAVELKVMFSSLEYMRNNKEKAEKVER